MIFYSITDHIKLKKKVILIYNCLRNEILLVLQSIYLFIFFLNGNVPGKLNK